MEKDTRFISSQTPSLCVRVIVCSNKNCIVVALSIYRHSGQKFHFCLIVEKSVSASLKKYGVFALNYYSFQRQCLAENQSLNKIQRLYNTADFFSFQRRYRYILFKRLKVTNTR